MRGVAGARGGGVPGVATWDLEADPHRRAQEHADATIAAPPPAGVQSACRTGRERASWAAHRARVRRAAEKVGRA